MITLADKEDKRFNIADTLKLQATMVPPPELKDKDMFDMKKKKCNCKKSKKSKSKKKKK
jgi:hypothetical protein|tara:strand:+ start:3064 stop:3240 length:177 start_codon:yes stop_codon:yes gene_type:complete